MKSLKKKVKKLLKSSKNKVKNAPKKKSNDIESKTKSPNALFLNEAFVLIKLDPKEQEKHEKPKINYPQSSSTSKSEALSISSPETISTRENSLASDTNSDESGYLSSSQKEDDKNEDTSLEEIKEEPKEEEVVVEEPSAELAIKLNQLDKRERIEIFKKKLTKKPPASTDKDAIKLINQTMTEVETKYGPSKDNRQFYHSKKYGRMFPVPKENIKFNAELNKTELITVGFQIYVSRRGSIEFWSKNRPSNLIFSKKSAKIEN